MTEWHTALDWVLRVVMALSALFVFLLGRDQKRNEELIQVKAKAVSDRLESEFAMRDLRLDTMSRRLDVDGEKLSALASVAVVGSGRPPATA